VFRCGADGNEQAKEDHPMSSRLLRIDAMVFRAGSVRFEACAAFRSGADAEVCECGWLETDHTATIVSRRQFLGRRPRRRLQPAAVRAAS
jgi:hypothetical protein